MNRGVYKVFREKKDKMQLTQKIRIFPSKEQEELLQDLSEKCRLIYNFALVERIEAWKKNGKTVNYTKQQNDLPKIKRKYPEYGWVYSKVLQMVLRRLDGDYKSFFALRKNGDKKAKPPRFKGRKHFTTMEYNQSGFKLGKERGWIEFSHNHPKPIPLRFTIPEKFDFTDKKVKQVTIFKKDGDEFYISIVYEKTEKPYSDNGLYQAIDLGITHIVTAVNSWGKFLQIKNQRPDKYWQSKIKEVQSKRDHCKKGSNRWKRYHEKVRKMQKRCSNQIKDFQHKLSRKLVENTRANTIIIGDLNVKNMANSNKRDNKRDRSLHRAVQNNGHLSRFARFLTYKAKLLGKRVIEISEENTTKICCACGKKQEMKVWDRVMRCDFCGNELDRDKNSAVNIMVRFLSQNAPVNGLSSFEDILRQTVIPIGMYSQEARL